MTNTRTRSTRPESADANPRAAGHDDWLIDEALDQTFPASDPTKPSRPGSLASLHRAGRGERAPGTSLPWLLGASIILLAVLAARRR